MTESDPEPVLVTYTVTCRTPECGNADIAIDLATVEGAPIFCGVCGQQINDVTTKG